MLNSTPTPPPPRTRYHLVLPYKELNTFKQLSYNGIILWLRGSRMSQK